MATKELLDKISIYLSHAFARRIATPERAARAMAADASGGA